MDTDSEDMMGVRRTGDDGRDPNWTGDPHALDRLRQMAGIPLDTSADEPVVRHGRPIPTLRTTDGARVLKVVAMLIDNGDIWPFVLLQHESGRHYLQFMIPDRLVCDVGTVADALDLLAPVVVRDGLLVKV